MPLSDLPSVFEKYDLLISNFETENSLDDLQPSSASLFPSTADLDITPLLFLRAAVAKIGLEEVTIDNLCLCFINNELIKIKISTPPEINFANSVCTPNIIKDKNLSFFNIQFTDFTATDIDSCISHVNSLIEGNLSSFLIYRLSINFFDFDVFKEDIFSKPASNVNKISLSLDDVQILLRYVDFTLYSRRLLNSVLDGHDTNSLPPHTDLIANLTFLKPKLTTTLEKKILNKSKVLKSTDERSTYSNRYIFKTITFENFYSIDLKSKSPELTALASKITNDFRISLQVLYQISFPSSSDKETMINKLKTSNNDLIKQGLCLQRILMIQREKHDSNFSSSLFATELLSIQKDESGSKTFFEIFNKVFFPDDATSCELFFDQQASYTLGCPPSLNLTFGPVSFASECQNLLPTTPRLTNNIVSAAQRLHGPVRFHPKLIKFACDLLSTSDKKILRPQNDDFPNFHTLFTLLIEQCHFDTRFLCKNSNEIVYHRMLKTESLLQRFHVLSLDENERRVWWPRNTIFSAKLVIMPYITDFDR